MRKVLILTLGILFLACIQQVQQGNVKLPSVNENLTMHVSSYSLKITDCEVNYTFTVDIINGKEIIRLKGVDSNCKHRDLYDRLNRALNGSVLVDVGDSYYLYMPSVSPYVVKYKPRDSILRYQGLPILTFYNVMRTFENAENVTYVGDKDGCQIFRYSLNDKELGIIHVEVYLRDNIPVKVILDIPQYDARIVTEIGKISREVQDFDLSKFRIVER